MRRRFAALGAVVAICGCGVFSGNIPLDANGRFTANGTWNLSIGQVCPA